VHACRISIQATCDPYPFRQDESRYAELITPTSGTSQKAAKKREFKTKATTIAPIFSLA
jgi:hypothetical protein